MLQLTILKLWSQLGLVGETLFLLNMCAYVGTIDHTQAGLI